MPDKKINAYMVAAGMYHDIDHARLELLKLLGEPEPVMEIDLSERVRLAKESIDTVRVNLVERGFHLQLPPDEDPSGWLDLSPKKG